LALSQEDYMRAIVDDDNLWKPMLGFVTPGTALYNEEGGEILKGSLRGWPLSLCGEDIGVYLKYLKSGGA
jgi:hypothetical protein